MSARESSPGGENRAARFEAIFTATHPRVLAYALRRTADRDRAEEVVSETFLVAWRRLDAMPSEPLPWLLGTARKVLANQRRSARRRSPAGPNVPLGEVEARDPGTPVDDLIAERDSFASAFAALGPSDRELLALIAWDGLKPGEAARVLGCSAATLSIRLHRARRRLLKELRASGHSHGEERERTPRQGRPGATEAR